MMMNKNKVIIFDTTLRDGEQAPGFSMSSGQKLAMAQALESLGVNVIEAGFAAASPGDFEAIKTIAENIKGGRLQLERFLDFSGDNPAEIANT